MNFTFFAEIGGGGGVGGDELSLRFIIFLLHGLYGVFGDECFIFRRSGVRITQCSYIGAYVVGLIIFGRYFCGSTSFRMSTRRLPVILFVSRFGYPIISCSLLRGAPVGAGGGFYFVCILWHVSNLRLIHGLLIIILLLPPPWVLRRPHRSRLCYSLFRRRLLS